MAAENERLLGAPATRKSPKLAREYVLPKPSLQQAQQARYNTAQETGQYTHAYLSGNFAPVSRALNLTPCTFSGDIPSDLAGGQYVRNGANPLHRGDTERDWHWFDGDGMLTGVLFRRSDLEDKSIVPEFVNQPVLTDVYLSASTTKIRNPIPPSIRTLINPLSSLLTITLQMIRAFLLVWLSRLPGSAFAIRRISPANTAIIWHDRRALATCENGPPMRIDLPELKTVGWHDGSQIEGESMDPPVPGDKDAFRSHGHQWTGFMEEFTTAHPRVDPSNDDLVLFHSTMLPPYVSISVIPGESKGVGTGRRLVKEPLPGFNTARLMHDFGVTPTHTVILDLPLTLNPLNLAEGKSAFIYDHLGVSRFAVFPRFSPRDVRWFESPAPCCIFHAANTWDEEKVVLDNRTISSVNMLVCRLINADFIYATGDLPTPVYPSFEPDEAQCRLYYYQFDLSSPLNNNIISYQWALSAIPFEFPTVRSSVAMAEARYIYGCSTTLGDFGTALGGSVKIDCLAKIDVLSLIQKGKEQNTTPVTGCVDRRTVAEILKSTDPHDPIQLFQMPEGWYAQEPRFVPRVGGTSEDDGWLLTYVFDESQLEFSGNAPPSAASELWILDGKRISHVVARIQLPQRVPYGFHGAWFSEKEILSQRAVHHYREVPFVESLEGSSIAWRSWMALRRWIEHKLG